MMFAAQILPGLPFLLPQFLHTQAQAGEVSGVVWRCWGQLQPPVPVMGSGFSPAEQSVGWRCCVSVAHGCPISC